MYAPALRYHALLKRKHADPPKNERPAVPQAPRLKTILTPAATPMRKRGR